MRSSHSFSFSIQSKDRAENYHLSSLDEVKNIFSQEINSALKIIKNMGSTQHNIKINFDIEVQNLGDKNA